MRQYLHTIYMQLQVMSHTVTWGCLVRAAPRKARAALSSSAIAALTSCTALPAYRKVLSISHTY